MRSLLSGLLLFCLAQPAIADQCDVENLNCLERATIHIGGVKLHDVCVRVQKTEACAISNPVKSCTDLKPLAQASNYPLSSNECRLVNEVCTNFAFGDCIEWTREFECFNAATTMGEAVLENRRYFNFQEEFTTQCDPITVNADCSYFRTEITKGFATRLINARAVTRSWWQREHQYDCSTGILEDTCSALDAQPICRQFGSVNCISRDSNGRCIAQREHFQCESDTSFVAQCNVVEICEDGSCDPEDDELGESYVHASAWLNFLDSITKSNNCDVEGSEALAVGTNVVVEDCVDNQFEGGHTEALVFNGQFLYCEEGVFDACRHSPSLYGRIQAGATHFLRSECRGFFCFRERDYYCAYNSKFARVFQEQAHLQTGNQFTDSCPGITIKQLETIDVAEMDLSEIFGDMLDQAEVPIHDLVIDRLSNELGVFQIDVQDTLGGSK